MLIEIKGEVSGTVVMFSSVAVELFKLMGLSGNTEGAIDAKHLPNALDSLRSGLAKLPATADQTDDEQDEPTISLQTRATPLLDLLEKNVAANGYVMWQPQ